MSFRILPRAWQDVPSEAAVLALGDDGNREGVVERADTLPAVLVAKRAASADEAAVLCGYGTCLERAKALGATSIAVSLPVGDAPRAALEVAARAAIRAISQSDVLFSARVLLAIPHEEQKRSLAAILEGADRERLEGILTAGAAQSEQTRQPQALSPRGWEPAPERIYAALEDQLRHAKRPFRSLLADMMREKGLESAEVYAKANLDRRLFSKILNEDRYHPGKKTCLALCVGLGLGVEESRDFLARAGWAFNPSDKVDLIVEHALLRGERNMARLNAVLYAYTGEQLGSHVH